MTNPFDLANSIISESLIRNLFDCSDSPPASDNKLRLKSPLRPNSKPSAFVIDVVTGLWFDHSTSDKGNLIDLVTRAFNLSKIEAANKICQTGGVKIQTKKKVLPTIPLPADFKTTLLTRVNQPWSIDRYGKKVAAWVWRNKKGDPLYVDIRYEKDGKKEIYPAYYGQDGKWHHGNPYPINRPISGLDVLSEDFKTPIIIVEGRKCADVKVDGYFLTTWPGGSAAVHKTDWTVLKDYENITIWPDRDLQRDRDNKIVPQRKQPGMKAALKIFENLPQAKILDVYQHKTNIDGWDIADCTDPLDFIKNTPILEIEKIEASPPEKEPGEIKDIIPPFTFLGYTRNQHLFLPARRRLPFSIKQGCIGKGQLFELAPESWWAMYFLKQKGGIDWDHAANWVISESNKMGYYKNTNFRGAGFWEDEGRIICNTGESLLTPEGERVTYEEFKTEYIYIQSICQMGNLSGRTSTDEEGERLIELFKVQQFTQDIDALVAVGWSLMSLFAGALKYRPHLWITGNPEIGKSWIMENLMQELTGPFFYQGSGSDSAPGTYRGLGDDARPIYKDEMEPTNKTARKKLDSMIELARNAWSDGSGYINLGNQSGGVDRFQFRSPCCFGSIIPYLKNPAIEGRFLILQLKNEISMEEKVEKTSQIIATGLMDDPGIFRRRIFKNIALVLKNAEWLHKHLVDMLGSQRKAHNYSTLLAAVYALTHDGPMTEEWGEEIAPLLQQVSKKTSINAGKTALNEILEMEIREKNGTSINISELVMSAIESGSTDNENEKLKLAGIKVIDGDLYVAYSSRWLSERLRDTQFTEVYGEILKRTPGASEEMKCKRISGKATKCVVFPNAAIKDILGGEE